MNQQINFLDIIQEYKNIVAAWKKRSDVISGFDLSYRRDRTKAPALENRPYSFGDGTGLTGFCVSASQSLLEDQSFQTLLSLRNSKAKLISIDLREQYFGYCFSGSQNIWHTAIFVEDSSYEFVIDITCRQFGNNFTDKDFWDFESWQNTLRSPTCKHNITDFKNNPKGYVPIINETKIRNKDFYEAEMVRNLHKVTNIDDNDRSKVVEFFSKNINKYNNKILSNNLTLDDINYVEKINNVLTHFPFDTYQKTYAVLEFDSKDALKNWVKNLMDNDGKIDMFLLLSKTLDQAQINSNINSARLNTKNSTLENNHFLVFECNNQFGIDVNDFVPGSSLLIPFNTQLNITNVFNGILINEYYNAVQNNLNHSEVIDNLSNDLEENNKTNTIWIICN